MNYFEKARELLKEFKGDSYLYGNGVLKDVGKVAASVGKSAVLIYTQFPGVENYVKTIRNSVEQAGVTLIAKIQGAKPNAPREDLFRITTELKGRDPGVVVANGMFAFAKAIDFPTTLKEVDGFTQAHIDRALTAAKNPQLKMKLENMPIPLTAEMIDEYMGPILKAAKTGNVSIIKNV